MDFGSVLYAAQKNEKSAHKDIKCYKTKFEPPKKEAKPKANLSANIQKYLQKREEEEKRKAEEERRKKEELLVLRSQDRKAFKRVQTMLKRTKSANKSVMEDAIDDVNTAVTMNGPQQCDEDDYGYVSQEASAFYAKLMDKYSSMPPEEPKFPQGKKPVVKDLNAAKDRVRAALQKEEEEEMMPHKRKRKSKSDKPDDENEDSHKEEGRGTKREPSPIEEPKHKKPKKMAPPPMDFSSLLKLAEQKQFEPVKIEKNIIEDETHRPMTKKQRLEYERELESRQRRMERERAREGQRPPNSFKRIPKISDRPNEERKEKPNGLGRIPKKADAVHNRVKSEKFNEDDITRNSVDPKNHLKNKPIPKTTNDRSTNSQQPERNHNKTSNPESRNKITSINDTKSEPLKNSYDRRSEHEQNNHTKRPSISSITQNKIKSRNHNISDEERSATSGSENERSKKRSLTAKSSILKSLFEGSDDESKEFSNHDNSRTQRELENKYKPSHDLERQKKTYNETKFKIPKGNSKSDLDRRKEYESSDGQKSSEKNRSSSSFDETKFKTSKLNSNSDLDRRKDHESSDRQKTSEKSRSYCSPSSKPDTSRDKYKSNEPKSDKPQSDAKSHLDKNRPAPERVKDKYSTTKDPPKKNISVESAKKTSSQSAEEVLKKSADVWSKPCNLSPSTAPTKAPGGLSESQIQRLREMNKKPTPSRPPQISFDRGLDGKSLQSRSAGPLQGRPNMLKAAAAASAARAASQNMQLNNSSRDKPLPKLERQSPSQLLEKQSSNKPPLSSNKSRELDKDSRPKQLVSKDERHKQLPLKDMKPKQFPPSDLKPRSFPPKDVRPRQFPPADVKPRQFPPADVRPRQFPPPDVKRKPKPRRIIDDDSEEYDSEMDDFIDDGSDEDTETISKEIQSIFGYDKNRYLGLDDDEDECMESNFDQIDREEMRSLKIGAAEDLKELLRDMNEKKRMKARKKQLTNKR